LAVGRELGRFLEHRRHELGLTRRQVADASGLSYPYVSQLETGDREPALKAIRSLAPVLDVPVEELASLVAGGDWATVSGSSFEPSVVYADRSRSYADASSPSAAPPSYNRDKVLLSLERRLREVPPLERIGVLNELISQTVEELRNAER
jgi:transcriptional regulator with XRE-family HTH domain